jgi:hypothetical protein
MFYIKGEMKMSSFLSFHILAPQHFNKNKNIGLYLEVQLFI